MANKVYPKFKKAAISGGANCNIVAGGTNVKLAMVDLGAYTYNDAHEFLSDVAGVVATSNNLGSKSASDGAAFQSGNGRFDAITGVSVEALVMYVDTGSPSTSRLVAFFDTGITGLPVTPAGTSYNIIVDPSGWFVM